MGGPAHHGHRAAAAGASLCFGSFRTCLALGRGCLVLERGPDGFFTGPAQCAFGPASCLVSFVLCAARGQRVLRGTEWTLCAPGRVRRASVQRVRFRRRARGSSQKIGARATPTLNTAHARAAASAFGAAVGRFFPLRGGEAAGRCAGRRSVGGAAGRARPVDSGSRGSAGYLVDPASSHMLVSKIKPCMSKYKRLYCETANGSLNQLWFI